MHGAADELCGNSRDDDGDSYTDMNDPDCMCSRGQNENGCASTECSNNRDDDFDTLIDMQDPGCADYSGE
jgi:hypothetical protein